MSLNIIFFPHFSIKWSKSNFQRNLTTLIFRRQGADELYKRAQILWATKPYLPGIAWSNNLLFLLVSFLKILWYYFISFRQKLEFCNPTKNIMSNREVWNQFTNDFIIIFPEKSIQKIKYRFYMYQFKRLTFPHFQAMKL